MGSEPVKGTPPEKEKTFAEIFEDVCPYYMSIGMSYDDFWNGDPEMAKYYRKAEKIRMKRENRNLWLQGLYIYHAVGDLAPILRFRTRGSVKAEPYLSEPFAIDEEEQKEREEKSRAESLLRMRDMLSELSRKKKVGDSGGRTDSK